MAAEEPAPSLYAVQPDDIVLCGFPKSGNNLALFRIVRLLYGVRMDWSTKAEWVQLIGKPPIANPARPRLVWTHKKYESGYPKVLYLVRDPRDVAVSFYFHQRKYFGPSGFDQTLDEFHDRFLAGKAGPASWRDHVEGWISHAAEIPNGFHVARYEDMVEDPLGTTWGMARFLGVPCSQEDVEDAIAWSSIGNMRRLEREQEVFVNSIAPQFSPPDRGIPFVREGRIGGWRSALTKEQSDRVREAWGATMDRFGYGA